MQDLLPRSHKQDFCEYESWVYYENNTHHAYWLPRSKVLPAQLKLTFRARNIMPSIFCDYQDAVLRTAGQKQTISADAHEG
ncbi:hypothetical protein KIN20_036978 [Parelaphostrongylus tenuis]|uniref:Uncharacterized protein n=1 Tax=Parelaphostrongylus tenuis TaxID=148309 RepID=A0AAD5RDG9_PARTN|nr:hypothetical protein KIN20_036978 [Parelaphostrongylus tenuis]